MKLALVSASVLTAGLLVSQRAQAQDQPVAMPSPAVIAACAADVRALCPGVQPGGGRILQCMRDKRDAVSEGCRSALAAQFLSQPKK